MSSYLSNLTYGYFGYAQTPEAPLAPADQQNKMQVSQGSYSEALRPLAGKAASVASSYLNPMAYGYFAREPEKVGLYENELLQALSGETHTITDDQMVHNNYRFKTNVDITKQLERNYGNPLLVDGYHYQGHTGWTRYSYTIEQIFNKLTGQHGLSEEDAVYLMNQLEVQIFTTPLVGLGQIFHSGNLLVQGGSGPSPISLNTKNPDAFEVKGNTRFEVKDLTKDSGPVATIDVSVCLHISKDPKKKDTGEWSWKISAPIREGIFKDVGRVLISTIDNKMMENSEQFSIKEAIVTQLKSPRYLYDGRITINGENWKGPELLIEQLAKEGCTEEKIVHLLNQLEIQMFAAPYDALTTDILLKENKVALESQCGFNIDLTMEKDKPYTFIGTKVVNIMDLNTMEYKGMVELGFEVVIPKNEGEEEQGRHTCKIT